MALSEAIRKQVEDKLREFCDSHIPPDVRDWVRLDWKFRGTTVTLYESRPNLPACRTWVDMPVAQLRFDENESTWELFCADSDGRWRRYINTMPTADFDALLREIGEDPTRVFWG